LRQLPPLSAMQRDAFATLVTMAQSVPVCAIEAAPGSGKTTLLRHLHQKLGGRLIQAGEALEAIGALHPHALEEAARRLAEEAFRRDDLVMFDDMGNFELVTQMQNAYPRPYLFSLVEKALFETARAAGKHLVVSRLTPEQIGTAHEPLTSQAILVKIADFTIEDYAEILGHWLGENHVAQLEFEKIFRHARKLTGHQLRSACAILQQQNVTAPTTEQFIECLNAHLLTSNLDVEEVEAVSAEQLKGTDELIEQLETLILLPMQEPELAKQLGLKPKRGVLLHGAPGTGKTSIGRMLAHRMKGKFFMIDGSFISEPPGPFFAKVNRIFEAARANSPAVIFIDDADLLFKTDHVYGLNRYLLTKLDGLESESVGSVCVMMTAMDIKDMPAAILRSGRVEVWLETKLPDLETRKEILVHYAGELGTGSKEFDAGGLAKVTEGFTPADLRRIIGDGKALMAYDMHKKRKPKSAGDYFTQAATSVRELKNKVARATGQPELPKIS